MVYRRRILLFGLFIFLILNHIAFGVEVNPYKNVQLHILKNGLTVVLSPSEKSKSVSINVRVDGGRAAETYRNMGVTHLLEHVVFTEAKLGEGQTYLQVVTEAGGKINAAVYERETIYYAMIGAEKSDWILDQFYKMLFHREFDDELIKTAKGSVVMEIGQPSWLAGLLRFDLIGPFKQRYFPWRDFYSSEFNIDSPNFSDDEVRLSNLQLKKRTIENYYRDYYKPDNMVLIFAGKFDPKHMLKKIKSTFGTIEDTPFEKKRKLDIKVRPYPYRNDFMTTGTPLTYLGTKFYKPTAVDEVVTYAYMEYLAHRMMKDLRNKKGETYTVYHSGQVNDEVGYSYIRFESPPAEVQKNFEYVEKIMQDETRNGKYSDELVKTTLDFYRKHEFGTTETDALSMSRFAYQYYRHNKKYGPGPDIFQILSKITPEQFRESLKKTFTPERAYVWIYRPPLYSKIDMNVLWVVVIILTTALFKALLKRPSPEVRIHWTAQAAHSPGLALEFLIVISATYAYCFLVDRPLTWTFDHFQFYKNSILINGYIMEVIRTFMFMAFFIFQFAFLPRRLIIDDYGLTIKNVAFYSWFVRPDRIKSIRVITPSKLLLNPRLWFNIRFRWVYFNWTFWSPGLLIDIKKGPIYFIGFDNAAKIKEDLEIHLTRPKNPDQYHAA
jgi:zinc protease